MKGVGGFVQSAMMKRSDSVNKRWSQQAPPDLTREQSRASHARSRSVYGEMSPRPTSRPASRPTSSHSNATVKQENERPGTSGSMTSNTTTSTANDGFIKPALPASRSDDTASVLSSAPSENIPTTPSKTMDSRRWSPTKSSWLESALSKPDAAKPKAAPSQQPSWMAEINKAKQRGTGSADQSRDPSPAHKHEVSIGGLMRSPAMGTSTSSPKPLGFGLMSPPLNTGTVSPTVDTKPTTPNTETESTPAASPSPTIESPATRTGTSAATKTTKPETPSKTDFRATLKSRQPPPGLGTKEEPEFKNVFGSLRRTQTSQYTPPDGLKDNILRGKAGLSHTGGPKAAERKDEFKDALLKKKDDFKKTQQEGASVLRSSSIDKGKTSSPLPEALAKRNTLGRSGSIPFIPPATTDARPDSLVIPEALAMRQALGRSGSYASSSPVKERAESESLASANAKPDLLQKEMGAPGRLPGKDAAPSKLAGRLNPALAGLLARGPPSVASDNSKSSSVTASSDHETNQGAQEIAHVTKGRARGPKRKAPSSAALSVATTSSQAPEPAARLIENMAKVESAKAAEKPLSTQTQPLPTPPAKASEPESSVRPVSPTKAVDKDSSSRPSSPSKLAMKRRSRFFEEASSSASAVPKPLSPQKTGSAELKNKFESLASQAAKLESSELKSPSPSATPKPLIPQKTGNADLRNKFESLTSQAAKKPESIEHRSPSPTPTPKPLLPQKTGNADLRSKFESLSSQAAKPEGYEHRAPSPSATPKPLAPQKTGNADLRNKFESLASQTAESEGPEPRSSSPLKKLGSADLKSKFEAMSGPAFASNAKPEVVESPTVKPPPVAPKTKPETIETSVLKPSSAAKSPSGAISPHLARKPWENRTNDKPEPATPIDATSSSRVSRAAMSPTLPILPPQNHVSDNGSNISKPSDNMAELPSAPNPTQSLPRADSRPSLLLKTSTSIRTLKTQASDTSELLADFFDTLDVSKKFTVDTTALLLAKPSTCSDLRTTQFQLYELADDGKKQQMSSQQERTLFESNMYLGIHAFISGGKKTTEVYLWIGDDVQEYAAEDAEFFAKRDAKTAGARLIRMKQGQETPEFFQAFGGVIIIRRGLSRQYDSKKPAILCGRRHHGQIAFDEVDFDPSSLCSGYPYLILSEKGKAYLWKGKGSGIDELSCARLVGMEMGCAGDIQEIEDGKEPAAFLQIFGKDAQIPESADHWRLKPNYSKYGARLFVSTGGTVSSFFGSSFYRRMSSSSSANSTAQITEVHPFCQSDLSPEHIYILDAFFEIYIVVGAKSKGEYSAFYTALVFAQEYGILAASIEDRPFVPYSTVVLEGVPKDMKKVFRKWNDAKSPTVTVKKKPAPNGGLQRGRSLRIVPLSAALEATRT